MINPYSYIKNQTTEPFVLRIKSDKKELTSKKSSKIAYRFFYHPDHIGSSSFITKTGGYAYQHLQYLPFGELFVNQQNGSYDTRYKFSAKELDNETGYSYFGARYYDSDLSVWLSVDPMSDERAWLSPYNYVQWNPVGRIDPTGALDDEWDICLMKDGSVNVTWKNNEGGDKTQIINFSHENNKGEHVSAGKPAVLDIDKGAFEQFANFIESNGMPSLSSTNNTQDGGSGDNRGQVISVANGVIAAGLGAMGDIGGVVDSYGNSKMYLTLGIAIGWGASAGMGYSSINKKMSMSDFSGWAVGINTTIPFTPLSVEGYKDMIHGALRDYYGNNLNGYGGNIGKGKGWFVYFSYTITFDPPSREFWLHPATHR